MNIGGIGSIGSYMKNKKMQTHWQIKKESGDLTSKKSLQEWLDNSVSSSAFRKKKDTTVDPEALYAKVQSGKKLTAAEKDYLRMHDPETLKKVEAVEQEKKSYEREIRRCKTKEEVQRAKFSRVSASLASVKSVENNPAIPIGQKLAHAIFELAKVRAIAEITAKFVKSGEYAKLPTEAEYREVMEEIKEEQQPETEEREDEASLRPETPAEEVEEPADRSKKYKEPLKSPEDVLRADVFEIEKVKRAKAKAAYRRNSGEWNADTMPVFYETSAFDAEG